MDAAIAKLPHLPAEKNDWDQAELSAHRESFELALRPSTEGAAGAEESPGLSLHATLDVLREHLPADGILTYDVGAHHHQVASQWRTDQPRNCLSTNGWSSMGIAMPAAYAAKLVYPERPVVAVLGDGCFHMTVGELNVARRLGLPIPHIVLNDGWLSLIRIKQDRRRYSYSGVNLGPQTDPPPHYFGVPCRPAHDEETLGAALAWAMRIDGPSVIEARINPESLDETVYD
jgi:acetolactate synthase-1/2/3 large subunit